MQAYSPGSLVTVRERDWIVLPFRDKSGNVLRLQPLTSSAAEEVGVYLPLEENEIKEARFTAPTADGAGDAQGSLLLFDAARLALRSSAAPFRCAAKLSVEPRPYQFVPLLMALRQEVVRLLIADDVGVGKTVEAGMIAREMLDRGLAKRLAVLCPSHLCEQWEQELIEKFGIHPAVIQSANFARLERRLPRKDISVYQHYPHLVASIDLVKSERHRQYFLDHAPDLVIVDEAHCASRPRGDNNGAIQQQRYELLRDLAKDSSRHLVLVTATPHNGVEENFRSILGLLDSKFDVGSSGSIPELDIKALMPHLIQRRRKDVERWLGSDTPFPKRDSTESSYQLQPEYRKLYEDALDYCKQAVADDKGFREAQQRIRHWAAIALLRCILSSPAAAGCVLEGRKKRLPNESATEIETTEEVDSTFRPQVIDTLEEEESSDYAPTAPFEAAQAIWTDSERKRLGRLQKAASELMGPKKDSKLSKAIDELADLVDDGFHPIVFCRFIPTARYVAEQVEQALKSRFPDIQVTAVTGEISDDERREKIGELCADPSKPRILVATDCLSEGINLQEHFDSVLHYDLPWNPNRLEQREGRVDRFGQRRKLVKTVLLEGSDNEMDIVVLDVLIRKAVKIHRDLGIAVPVPAEAERLIEETLEDLLLRGGSGGKQLKLQLEGYKPKSTLHEQLDRNAEASKNQHARFSQKSIKPEDIEQELKLTHRALGDRSSLKRFLAEALPRFNGKLETVSGDTLFSLEPGDLGPRLAQQLDLKFPLLVTLDRQKDEEGLYIGRTHPLVAAICEAVLARAFQKNDGRLSADQLLPFARTGARFTGAVQKRTGLALLRFRYHCSEDDRDEFAEEVIPVAFQDKDGALNWVSPDESLELLETNTATANMPAPERRQHVDWALDLLTTSNSFQPLQRLRMSLLTESHSRVRKLLKQPKFSIRTHEPDVLACFVLVPGGTK